MSGKFFAVLSECTNRALHRILLQPCGNFRCLLFEMDAANDTTELVTDELGVCSTQLAIVEDKYCPNAEDANLEPLGRVCIGDEQSDDSQSTISSHGGRDSECVNLNVHDVVYDPTDSHLGETHSLL